MILTPFRAISKEVKPIVLGTAQFGMKYGIANRKERTPASDVTACLELALESGIQTLDCAQAYGDAAQKVEQFHLDHPSQKFQIITKVSADTLQTQADLEKHLGQFGVDQFQAILLHRPTDVANAKFVHLLKETKKAGLTRKLGLSIYTNEECVEAAQLDWVDLIQLPFNLLDHAGWKKQGLDAAKKLGKEIHVRSVFLQGLLLMSPNEVPSTLGPMTQALKDVQALAQKMGISVRELALRYVESKPELNALILGVDSPEHLQELLQTSRKPLPTSVIQKVESIRIHEPKLLNPSQWTK